MTAWVLLAEVVLRRLLHLLKDHGGDLWRSKLLLAALDQHAHVAVRRLRQLVGDNLHLLAYFLIAPPHEALNGVDRVLRVGDGLALSNLTDQTLPIFCEPDHGGGQAATLRVCDDFRLPAFHHGDY